MTTTIKLHLRLPSPNNTKVQIALAYKGIEPEVEAVQGAEPETLAKLVAISGQPLTPILEHNGVVMFDSGAILRYIDANFDGPRLFSPDPEEMKQIESWEAFHRSELSEAFGPAIGLFFGRIDASEAETTLTACNAAVHEMSAKIEARLAEQAFAGSDWLVGDSMTAADLFVSCLLSFAAFPPGLADCNPLWKWFGERLTLGEGRDLCRAHICRVLAFLPVASTA